MSEETKPSSGTKQVNVVNEDRAKVYEQVRSAWGSAGEGVANNAEAMRDDASVMRLNEQCFLMENITAFSQKAPQSYQNITVYTGSPQELQKKLNAVTNMRTFMELTPYQMAVLVPEVAIFLVKADAGHLAEHEKSGNDATVRSKDVRKVEFANRLRADIIDEIMTPQGYGTVRAARLTELFYETSGDTNISGGGDTGATDTRICTMKFAAESLAALSYRPDVNKSASLFDMVMSPTADKSYANGSLKVSNKNFFMVRVAFGYRVPQGYRDVFAAGQLEAIRKAKTYMIMNQSKVPKISLKEDGQVEVELNYLARVEVDPFKGTGLFDDNTPPRGSMNNTITATMNERKEKEAGRAAQVQRQIDAKTARKRYAALLTDIYKNMDESDVSDLFGDGVHDAVVKGSQDGGDPEAILEHANHSDIIAWGGEGDSQLETTVEDNMEYIGPDNPNPEMHPQSGLKKPQWSVKEAMQKLRDAKSLAEQFQSTTAEVAQGVAGDRMEKYSRTMRWLLANNKIYSMLIPKEALGIETTPAKAFYDPNSPGGISTSYNKIKRTRLSHLSDVMATGGEEARANQIIGGGTSLDERQAEKHLLNAGYSHDEIDEILDTKVHAHGVDRITFHQDFVEKHKKLHEKKRAVEKEYVNNQEGANKRKVDVANTEVQNTGSSHQQQVQSTQETIAKNTAAKANVSSEDVEKIKSDLATSINGTGASTGFVEMDDAQKNVKIHYTYFGNLIEAVVHRLGTRMDGSISNPKLLLGVLDYRDPDNLNVVKSVPLTDIPISISMYRWWLMKFMVDPMIDYSTIDQFIDSIVKDLLYQIMGGDANGCFTGTGVVSATGQQGVMTRGIEALGAQGGINRLAKFDGGRFGTESLNEIVPPDPDYSFDAEKKTYHYIVMSALFFTEDNIKVGNVRARTPETDEAQGKYWVSVRSDKGPVHSVSFEEMDTKDDDVARAANDEVAARYGIGGGLFTLYKVNVKMMGNGLFKLGSDFFLNTGTIGDLPSEELAEALGFGGDYQVNKITGTINEAGWVTEIQGYPKARTKEQTRRFEAFIKKQTAEQGLWSKDVRGLDEMDPSEITTPDNPNLTRPNHRFGRGVKKSTRYF